MDNFHLMTEWQIRMETGQSRFVQQSGQQAFLTYGNLFHGEKIEGLSIWIAEHFQAGLQISTAAKRSIIHFFCVIPTQQGMKRSHVQECACCQGQG